MKLFKQALATVALCLAVAAPALAQERGSADEAKALVEKGLAHIKAVGLDKAAADFTAKDGKWQNKDLYLFVEKFDGVMLGHGANAALVGKNLSEMKDANGKTFVKDLAETAKTKGSGWVDYMWVDPATKKTAAKSSYVVRVPNSEVFIGAGIYK
jgi:cytochrome c